METEIIHKDELKFWNNVLLAIRVKPLELPQIRGVSGLVHQILASGVDETSKRLVVVSGEHDGRSAALVQADIQAAFTDYRVLTIRPAMVSIPKLAKAFQLVVGNPIVTDEFFQELSKEGSELKSTFESNLEYAKTFGKSVSVRSLPQVLDIIQQLAQLKLYSTDISDGSSKGKFQIDLTNILSFDPIADDRKLGICAFPFYDFESPEIEGIATATSVESVSESLRLHDILQFFFPGPDQLALGLVERGIRNSKEVLTEVNNAPTIGHPFGVMEILDPQKSTLDLLDSLEDRKLLVEGEYGYEISEEGLKTRVSVKFKPKEGLISKLFSRFALKIDIRSIFGGGK